MTESDPTHEFDDATAEYDVRADLPVYECDRCGRPFAREAWLALHRGLAHPGDLGDEDVASFRAAHDDEDGALRRFRLRALGTLVLVYFGLLMVYAVV